MKNIKFFDGQVVDSDDLNNLQEYKADDIRHTRLDTRTVGVVESVSQSPLIYIDSDKKIGVFGLTVYDSNGERITVPTNENPALPYIDKLLPDETGKLVTVGGSDLLPATTYTMVIRHTELMAPPLKHHVTTGETFLITNTDSFELYLRPRGGQTEGDVVLANIVVDDAGGITVDYSATEYSFIKSDEVATTLSGDIQVSGSDDYSGNISFTQHINSVGSGTVSTKNPHGLSPADLGIDIGALADHQTLLHSDGIRTDNILSTSSAMYPYYRRETANNYEVLYIQRLDTSYREICVINGKTITPSDFSSSYSFSFEGLASDDNIGYYLFSYDSNSRSVVMNGPYASELSSGFVSTLNTSSLFPICSFKFDAVTYDVTGDDVPDIENNYDIIPGTFKDRRKFNNISIANMRPDEVSALSQFAPYCNDRAYLHNARVIGANAYGTFNVADKQLSLVIDGDEENPLVITFRGANPFEATTVIDQIMSQVATVDSDGYTYLRVYPRITESGAISLSAPMSIKINTLEGNDAGPVLGFSSDNHNLQDTSSIIKELIYVGDRNGIVLFTYNDNDQVTYIEYLLGGGLRRFNTFTYNGDLITSVREGVEPL